jgi:hypothetical protein
VLRKKLPVWRLRELKAVLYRVFQIAIEATGRRRGLAPYKILAKQKALFLEPEDYLILERAAFVASAFGTIIEDEAPVWFERAE